LESKGRERVTEQTGGAEREEGEKRTGERNGERSRK
jgi:hypothetical protein